MRQVKQRGFSDSQIARCLGTDMMAGERSAGAAAAGRPPAHEAGGQA